MNPLDELKRLTSPFAAFQSLFANVDHVPSSQTPEPYKAMLVHEHHMTVTMEDYHSSAVDVRILDRKLDGDVYDRMIVLKKTGTNTIVQFGVVRFHLNYVTPAVREQLLAGDIPLGRVLINHNVLRHIDLGAILRVKAGPLLAEHLQMAEGAETYGRMATIFCNGSPAVDLLEISTPLSTN